MKVRLKVNGRAVEGDVAPRTHLADFLREHLNLTGTHIGCEHGVCGACTVTINGETARSCITYAVTCEGADVRTVEGFPDDALMGRLRQAFKAHHALQCGYCTPGMLIAARDLIRRKGGLDEGEIRHAMSGNLCRCTGYVGIVGAIREVMAERASLLAEVEPPARYLGPLPPEHDDTPLPARASTRPQSVAQPTLTSASTSAPAETWDEAGATRIAQSVDIAAPKSQVASFMRDIEQVAACLPGARLSGPPVADRVAGTLNVKLGPIAVAFAGDGRFEQAADGFSGLLEGAGRDGASKARGRIRYKLDEAGSAATRLGFEIAYSLTGPLAQFSRGDLVKDLVTQITRAFAANIEARLKNPSAPMRPAELKAASLLWTVVWARIKALLGLR